MLGLPDFYDTDYSEGGGQSHDIGGWDVMAGGADYNHGRSPVVYSYYERYALGWAQGNTITESGSYTLNPVNTSREGYILRTPVENEFFVFENRQKTGWDTIRSTVIPLITILSCCAPAIPRRATVPVTPSPARLPIS